MLIEKYGVTLRRLEDETDIELVRQWRNSPEVNQFMFFRDHITPEMQKSWFERINNQMNYYFIIERKHEKIGLANLKGIDYATKKAETGIFIGEEKHRMDLAGVQATAALLDFGFEELKLASLHAHIVPDNIAAISFNKALGFKLKSTEEHLYELTKEDYDIKKIKIQKVLAKIE